TFQMGSLSSPSLQGLSLESTGTGRTEDNAALDDLFRYIKWQAGDICVRPQNTTAEKKMSSCHPPLSGSRCLGTRREQMQPHTMRPLLSTHKTTAGFESA
ncbi:hypothetical protein, partial [Insolitispirillum peregrinum]